MNLQMPLTGKTSSIYPERPVSGSPGVEKNALENKMLKNNGRSVETEQTSFPTIPTAASGKNSLISVVRGTPSRKSAGTESARGETSFRETAIPETRQALFEAEQAFHEAEQAIHEAERTMLEQPWTPLDSLQEQRVSTPLKDRQTGTRFSADPLISQLTGNIAARLVQRQQIEDPANAFLQFHEKLTSSVQQILNIQG